MTDETFIQWGVLLFVSIASYIGISRLFSAAQPPEDGEEPWNETLVLPPDATMEEIEAQYHRLCAQFDPAKVAHLGEEYIAMAESRREALRQALEKARRHHGDS